MIGALFYTHSNAFVAWIWTTLSFFTFSGIKPILTSLESCVSRPILRGVNFDLRLFGPKRDEVTGEWRKLHNEELSDLYSLPNIVRVVNREE